MSKLTKENSKLQDSQYSWKEDYKMRDAMKEYVRICENCLNQFDKSLDQTSKEKILKPLQLIIRHLCVQNSLLYNGWRNCEEDWLKKVNAQKRKSEQNEAMRVFENDNLSEKVSKMEDDLQSFENLITKRNRGTGYSDQDFDFNYANGEKIKSIVKNWSTNGSYSRENVDEGPSSSFSEDKLLSRTDFSFPPVDEPSNQGSNNNNASCHNVSHNISRSSNNSEDKRNCKCLCSEYQLINEAINFLKSDSECLVLNDVKSRKYLSQRGKEEENKPPSSSYEDSIRCQCNNAYK